jgi:hypothetical protein
MHFSKQKVIESDHWFLKQFEIISLGGMLQHNVPR